MYSFSFPKMVSINKANLIEGKEATMSNLALLLESEKKSLFGDPYFGTSLKKFIYEQNDRILIDIVVDEIYTSILTFMPQIRLERKGITITTDGSNSNKEGRPISNDGKHIYVHINGTYILDESTIDYTIVLLGDEE